MSTFVDVINQQYPV